MKARVDLMIPMRMPRALLLDTKPPRRANLGTVLLCVFLIGHGSVAEAQNAEFLALGDLPGGDFESWALTVSDDGRTVAGVGMDGNVDVYTGFLWSPESGMEALGDTSDGYSAFVPQRRSMSPDGKYLVGRIRDLRDGSYRAFRWTSESGFENLHDGVGEFIRSAAWGVSADGSVVVGRAVTNSGEDRAFRWTPQSGITSLGVLRAGDTWSVADGVSRDGNVIVGLSGETGTEAYRWTESGGMNGLGSLYGELGSSYANHASSDGSVIVGSSSYENDEGEFVGGAFRWTENEGMSGLDGHPPDTVRGEASAVSDSGSVIVGNWHVANPQSFLGFDNEAFVWTNETGALLLKEALISGGVQGLENWTLEEATDVSGNGQWVVGSGINPDGNQEAFLARLDSVLVPRFTINSGSAGAWANFSTLGQGQLIDVDVENQFIFLAWFTYTDADSDDPTEQRWLTAQGNYTGDNAVLPLYETLGGAFDDPQAVSTEQIGEVTLSFTDCGHGRLDYYIDDEALSGTFPIERVIPGSGGLCESETTNRLQAVAINAGMDGGWYDENTPGQGFLFDVHPDPEGGNFIFVAWFTYGEAAVSGQRWLTAQGPFEGSIAEIEVYETTGGSFNDPQPAETIPVGSMSIDFSDCSNALLSYSLTDGTGEGQIDLARLLPGSAALCEELAGLE